MERINRKRYFMIGILATILVFSAIVQSNIIKTNPSEYGISQVSSITDSLKDLIYIYTGEPAEDYFGYVDVTDVLAENKTDELWCTITIVEGPPVGLNNTVFYTFMFDENNDPEDNCPNYPTEDTDTMYTVIYRKTAGWTIERAKYQVVGDWWMVEATKAGFGLASSLPGGFSISIWIPLTELPGLTQLLPWKVKTETFNGVSIGDLAPDVGRAYFPLVPVLPHIIEPADGASVYKDITIFAGELTDPTSIMSALFEYSSDGMSWIAIGTDTNGSIEVKNEYQGYQWGVWTCLWNTASLNEGWYYVKVTMTNTKLVTGQDQVRVFVDSAPPLPIIVRPTLIDEFEVSITGTAVFEAKTIDENVVSMKLEYTAVPSYFEKGLEKKNQHNYGPLAGADPNAPRTKEKDPKKETPRNDWDSNDYCGPTSAASSLVWWSERGFRRLFPNVTQEWLVEELGRRAKIKENNPCTADGPEDGVTDPNLVDAMRGWIKECGYGDTLEVKYVKKEDFTFKKYKTELLACEDVLISTPYHWMVANSVNNTKNQDGTYNVDFMDPWTGTYRVTKMKLDGNFEWPPASGIWTKDTMIVTSPADPELTVPKYTMIGLDTDGTDGWSVPWDTTNMPQSRYYLLRVTMTDTNGRPEREKIVVFVSGGDVNRDSKVDIRDIGLVAKAFGTEPGDQRWNPIADVNADNKIDIRDIAVVAKAFGKTY